MFLVLLVAPKFILTQFEIDCGVHPSLHANYHHNIIYSKLNVKLEYQPLYEQLSWNYKNADLQAINKPIEGFIWERAIRNRDTDIQAGLSNETIIYICQNYIPHK